MIAAYKDLPGPVKELIDWDQQRLDVRDQVQAGDRAVHRRGGGAARDAGAGRRAAAAARGPAASVEPVAGRRVGHALVESVSFEAGLDQHVAIVGRPGSGASELAQMLARLVPPTGGSIEMGGIDMTRAPEAVTGRALGYVGSPAYLFPARVRENIVYGLKHRPIASAPLRGRGAPRSASSSCARRRAPATATLDINADWIDYAGRGLHRARGASRRASSSCCAWWTWRRRSSSSACAARPTRRRRRRRRARARRAPPHARAAASRSASRTGSSAGTRPRYNRNATLAENLLFGTPVGRAFDIDNLAANAYVRQVLRETGLDELLLRTGHKVAETMVELFSGLPPGHEFFAQYSFISQDDLPQFEAILKRAAEVGLKGLDEAERARCSRCRSS